MIVKGQHKEVKYTNVDIEVSPRQVLYDIYWPLLKDKPNKASYIRDGYWYVEDYFDYHKRENVEKKDYPNILVTTGLHDSQVQYFEPAKWVAKLRDYKTDKHILLLKTEMNFGHGGASGRFDYLKEIALNYAFLFKLEGIKK